MWTSLRGFAVAFVATILGASSSQATVYTIDSFDNGSYSNAGDLTSTSIRVGTTAPGAPIVVFRNWLAFDLATVSAPITSATLTFFGTTNGFSGGNGIYLSQKPAETYFLSDYT